MYKFWFVKKLKSETQNRFYINGFPLRQSFTYLGFLHLCKILITEAF